MAEDQDDSQEKSIDPTPQRIERAREQGDVPKSVDVNTLASYVALLLVVIIAGADLARDAAGALSTFLASPHLLADRLLAPGGPSIAGAILGATVVAVAPFCLVPAAAVIIALVAQRSVVFSTTKVEPKLSRLSLISNAKQKFGSEGIVEFLKSLAKLLAIGIVVTIMVSQELDGLAALVRQDARTMAQVMMDEVLLVLGATIAIVGVIAAIDYVWQQHAFIRRNRMSQQELKDELKSTEGDPFFRQTRRDRARQIAMNRSIDDVPNADVVIANPIHFAVALKWSRKPGSAPICIAKGADAIALRIRAIAEDAGVPVHEDPPTARLLFDVVEIGDEIAPEHYQAVAVSIRFADATRQRAKDAAFLKRRETP